MDAQGTAATFGKHSKIAAGWRRLHHTEGVLLSGHRQILSIVASNLQEDAAIGAALVALSGGLHEARAEAEYHGHLFLVAHPVAHALQDFFVFVVHRNVAEY